MSDRLIGWQPIETCQDHPLGFPVLLCIHPVYRCFVGLKCHDGSFVSIIGTDKDGREITITPTHWMYLPDEPKKDSIAKAEYGKAPWDIPEMRDELKAISTQNLDNDNNVPSFKITEEHRNEITGIPTKEDAF